MSESNQAPTRKPSRRSTAILGLVVVFLIALLVNFLAGKFNVRADLTEYDIYTLSDGTRNILEDLETPVTVRYYVTDDRDVMSPGERARAQRVEDMLDEFVRAAPVREVELVNEEGDFEKKKQKMLQVEKLNPKPNTDAEDAAIMDGLEAAPSNETNNQIYFGIAVEAVDSKETIPFVPARPETMLEYDLARAISNVHGGEDKKIVVMTGMSVGGGFSGNFQQPPQQAWMFYEQLNKDYEMQTIPATSAEIPEDASALLVLHPYDITPEAQFAIDQYLLGGGNVIAFLDPNFFYSRALQQQQQQRPGMPPQAGGGPAPSSNLDALLSSWGVKFDANRVLADLDYGSEIMRRGNFSPTFLTLDQSALGEPGSPGRTDPMTRMLNHLNMLTPGAFEIEAPPGIEVARLVRTSDSNQLVSAADADPTAEGGAERIRQNFEPYGERRTLVARLSGSFGTAFPEGNPAASDDGDDGEQGGSPSGDDASSGEGQGDDASSGEGQGDDAEDGGENGENGGEEEEASFLEEAKEPGRVLLFSDVDFIYDANVVRRNRIPGLNISMPELLNENLTLVQNAVEQMAGDPNLIDVRSRTSVRRPFTRQNEWLREAQQQYADELEQFREKRREAEQRLSQLLAQTPENVDEAMLSPEVQKELEKLQQQEIEFRRKERELEKEVTQEFRRKMALYKFGNSLLMPILVVLFGIGLAIYRKTKTAAR